MKKTIIVIVFIIAILFFTWKALDKQCISYSYDVTTNRCRVENGFMLGLLVLAGVLIVFGYNNRYMLKDRFGG